MPLADDPAVVKAPWGPEVDGRRLLNEAVGFGRALRAAGLHIDIGAAVDYARALPLVDIGEREQVRAAGEAIFIHRRDDMATYDAVFDRWWRQRNRRQGDFQAPPLQRPTEDDGTTGEEAAGQAQPQPGEERIEGNPDERGIPMPSASEDVADDDADIEGVVVAPDAYSRGEMLRHREFDRMTPSELREAERLVDLLVPRLERRRTRRYELHSHGRRLAPRAMFRQNLGTGGQLMSWVWRRQIKEPRSLVVICDISGSMERHSRLLLRFVQALSAASEVRTESFVFGTRLTRVTRLLKDRDRDRALARVADTVNDWAGGTRIGESFRTFNQHWARRTLRTSGVVIVVSRWLGPRRPGARGGRDRAAASELPSARVAQSAGRHARLPAARRRHARGDPVRGRLPARRDGRQPGAPGRDPGRRPIRRYPPGLRGGGPCRHPGPAD